MSNSKDLTFSIVAYKNYNQIFNAIDSINKFTKNYNIEVIVIDNTEEIFLKNYINKINDIKNKKNTIYIANKSNLGFGAANNIALKKAQGRYFVICNPDILMVENSFDKIIPYLESNLNVGAVIPRLVDRNHQIEPVYRRELTLFDIFVRYFHPWNLFNKRRAYHTMQDKDYSKPFRVPFGQGSFLVVRTELMQKLNGFDEQYFMYVEDADLCKRINEISILEYFPKTEVIHLWEKGSHKNIKLMKWHMQALIKYFKKWGIK